MFSLRFSIGRRPQAMTSATGNPAATSTITNRTTQVGISKNGKTWVATWTSNQPTMA